MTLKERVFKVRDLLLEKQKLQQKKKQIKEVELNLCQDWEKEIERLKKEAEVAKEIEKHLDTIREELDEHASYFFELIYTAKLEKLTFDLVSEILIVKNSPQPFLLIEKNTEASQTSQKPTPQEPRQESSLKDILAIMKENKIEDAILQKAAEKIAPNKSLEDFSQRELASLQKYIQKVVESRKEKGRV